MIENSGDILFKQLFYLKGDDDVAVCKIFNGVGSVEHYYNEGKTTLLISNDNPTIGFSNISVSYHNDILKCSFVREKSMKDVNNYFDILATKYYILVANGELDEDGKLNLP